MLLVRISLYSWGREILVSFDKKSKTMTYDFKGQEHTFTVTDSDGIGTNTDDYDYGIVQDFYCVFLRIFVLGKQCHELGKR